MNITVNISLKPEYKTAGYILHKGLMNKIVQKVKNIISDESRARINYAYGYHGGKLFIFNLGEKLKHYGEIHNVIYNMLGDMYDVNVGWQI